MSSRIDNGLAKATLGEFETRQADDAEKLSPAPSKPSPSNFKKVTNKLDLDMQTI